MHIYTEANVFAQALKIDNRVETLAPKESFITLKDHKDNFQNNPTCRLINPTKPELGKVSKQIKQSHYQQNQHSPMEKHKGDPRLVHQYP